MSEAASAGGPVDAAASPAPATPRKLDDVLLAMDVVDTLRHREQMVDRELNAEEREESLIRRLREIYSAQGIDVPDRILRDGVAALEEERFVYRPPPNTLSVRLARLYVSRDQWLGAVGWTVGALAASAAAYQFLWAGPRNAEWARMPSDLAAARAQGVDLAQEESVDERFNTLYSEGVRATEAGDRTSARFQLQQMQGLISLLAEEYDVRIVSRPGESTGVFRIPDDVPNARNYYLIVEAVAPGGVLVDVPITSEETQETRRVSKWGQRVTEEAYNRVAADKGDDQIVQNDVLGYKARGVLEPDYAGASPGGAILAW
ncbi:hypothetical protein GC169_07100 [bacterium]|nr:hypothetical protein [bacterium]